MEPTLNITLTNMKDLEFICEVATHSFKKGGDKEWAERAHKYRLLFGRRIGEQERKEERQRER